MTKTRHEVQVKFQRAWREYRAECSCGWTGSYFESVALAQREGERHHQSDEVRLMRSRLARGGASPKDADIITALASIPITEVDV